MSKARPNNRRVFRNRPAIKYHSQFHNVIGSVMRNRSGWIKANEEDESAYRRVAHAGGAHPGGALGHSGGSSLRNGI